MPLPSMCMILLQLKTCGSSLIMPSQVQCTRITLAVYTSSFLLIRVRMEGLMGGVGAAILDQYTTVTTALQHATS